MDQLEKTLTININLETKEFNKKMEDSVDKLKMTEDELKDLKELLGSFSSTFISFGTEAFKYQCSHS